jgi:hypothetical protein
MAAADQQFLDALKYVGQQGQEYGVKMQMNDINSRAQEIRNTMTDEIQQRQALRNLTQQASLSIAGSGGSAQQMAAVNNLLPPIPHSVNEAYIQGTLTGDKQMVGVAQQMLAEDQKRHIELEQQKAVIHMKLEESKEGFAMKKDLVKSNRSEYEKMVSAKAGAEKYLADLVRSKSALKNSGLFVDTGPLDQYMLSGSNAGQEIKSSLNTVGVDTMMSFIKEAGGVRAADTGAEQERIMSTAPNISKYKDQNVKELDTAIKNVGTIIDKFGSKIYSHDRSNGLSFDAYASEYSKSKGTASRGVSPLAPVDPGKSFVTMRKGR